MQNTETEEWIAAKIEEPEVHWRVQILLANFSTGMSNKMIICTYYACCM